MKKSLVLRHLGGTVAVAKLLGISPAAVSRWPEIIPEGKAYKLEKLTNGALRVDPALYQKSAA